MYVREGPRGGLGRVGSGRSVSSQSAPSRDRYAPLRWFGFSVVQLKSVRIGKARGSSSRNRRDTGTGKLHNLSLCLSLCTGSSGGGGGVCGQGGGGGGRGGKYNA